MDIMMNTKKVVRLLIVGSGPTTKYLPTVIDDYGKMKQNSEIFQYLLNNNLIKGGGPIMEYFYINELPMKYWEYFMSTKLHIRDFDKYRSLIAETIIKLFGNSCNINYTCVDPSGCDPVFANTMNIVHDNDLKAFEEYGIQFIFNKYVKLKFQEHIKQNVEKYDIIWFLNCGRSKYIIDKDCAYINNFKNNMNNNGYIIHSMPVHNKILADFTEWNKYQNYMPDYPTTPEDVLNFEKQLH